MYKSALQRWISSFDESYFCKYFNEAFGVRHEIRSVTLAKFIPK